MENYETMFKQATALHLKGDLAQALSIYDRLLAHQPENAHLLACTGTALSQTQAFGLAIQLLTKATALKDIPDAWHNLGISYRTMGLIDKAVECYQHELAIPGVSQKDAATVYANWSGCYVNEGNPERVIELADQGLRYDPTSPQLQNHKSLALLELGRYDEGFALYEARYRLAEFTPRDFGLAPRWDGKAVGKLAIHGEQGIGDEVLFLSYLRHVLPLAQEVAVECTPRLVGLLKYSFRNEPKVTFYPDHKALTSAFAPDAWCAMGSLPLYCGRSSRHVYLEPSRAYFRSDRPRLGISWRGGTLRTHEYHRNAPLEFWKPLIERIKGWGVDVISLQYGPAKEMAEHLGIPHDESNITDLDMLAAMIRSCDRVLSVCNTTIHMAGALGVPCTVLVPEKPAWRYGLKGEKSEWYESVDYIRQAKDEGWDAVLARATKITEEWAKHATDHRRLQDAERAQA